MSNEGDVLKHGFTNSIQKQLVEIREYKNCYKNVFFEGKKIDFEHMMVLIEPIS